MGDRVQLTIAGIGLLAALITLAASLVERKRAAAPGGSRKRAGCSPPAWRRPG
jgi:hypothetical protein